MSVVGLTFGSGANAIRPSAASAASVATSASIRERRVRALVPGEARRRARPRGRSARRAPRSRRRPRSSSARAAGRRPAPASARRRRARPRRGRARSRSRSTSRRRAPRRRARRRSARPSASRTTRSASAAANSASCVATSTATPRAGELAQAARRASPLAARSMPRVGSSSSSAAGGVVAAEDDRQREPLALAAGEVARVAVAEAGRARRARAPAAAPRRRRARAGGSRRVLQQQRDAPGRLDACRASAPAGRRGGAAASTCRRRCGPSARRARPARAPGRRRAGSRGRRRAPARRRARRRAGSGRLAAARQPRRRARGARRRRRGASAACAGSGSRPCARSVARASLTPLGGGRSPARANSRAAGVSSAGLVLGGPLEHRARRRVAGDRAVAQRDHAVGVRQAALEPVLGEHDRRAPLLVEPAQQPDQLVAGDRVELRGRLVEQHERRAPGERGAERDALQLAAGELVRRAVEQVGDAERERRLLDPARDGRGGQPAVLERKASSARTVPITICVSGSWSSVPQTAARSPGPCSRVSRPPTTARPANSPPWKCGTSPQAARSSVDLPDAESPASDDELARLDAQRDVVAAPAPAASG